ncbi:hypothetical protein SAMN05216214_103189 [Atopomonas hussainii]|uniref:Uncharacterized protein n=1 Tax=Atopomonas hussainii TaxID=1429083 RepID=A0A1H7I630_9GAMM|nr:hypothetical protein SAMN05216214_103189 [Atopomonas hussainii]
MSQRYIKLSLFHRLLAALCVGLNMLCAGLAWGDISNDARRWAELRQVPGHFMGAAPNPAVDHWQGEKHQLMRRLFEYSWQQALPEAELLKLWGAPDKIWPADDPKAAALVRMTEWRGKPAGRLLAYHWRGEHDQLLFAVDEQGLLRAAGWMMVWE